MENKSIRFYCKNTTLLAHIYTQTTTGLIPEYHRDGKPMSAGELVAAPTMYYIVIGEPGDTLREVPDFSKRLAILKEVAIDVK